MISGGNLWICFLFFKRKNVWLLSSSRRFSRNSNFAVLRIRFPIRLFTPGICKNLWTRLLISRICSILFVKSVEFRSSLLFFFLIFRPKLFYQSVQTSVTIGLLNSRLKSNVQMPIFSFEINSLTESQFAVESNRKTCCEVITLQRFQCPSDIHQLRIRDCQWFQWVTNAKTCQTGYLKVVLPHHPHHSHCLSPLSFSNTFVRQHCHHTHCHRWSPFHSYLCHHSHN